MCHCFFVLSHYFLSKLHFSISLIYWPVSSTQAPKKILGTEASKKTRHIQTDIQSGQPM